MTSTQLALLAPEGVQASLDMAGVSSRVATEVRSDDARPTGVGDDRQGSALTPSRPGIAGSTPATAPDHFVDVNKMIACYECRKPAAAEVHTAGALIPVCSRCAKVYVNRYGWELV